MELPYTTDYAKSNRAICRGCSNKIVQETLRLAIMLQSPTFDGKVPNWYHFSCFFNEHMPESVDQISHYDLLRWEDQKKIKSIIDDGESPLTEEDAQKVVKLDECKATVGNYSISYSKSSQCPCQQCDEKIKKDHMQVIKKLSSSKSQRFHLRCFYKNRHDIGYLECGTKLLGYKDLEEDDKSIVKRKLVRIVDAEEVPIKKTKLNDVIEISDEEDETVKSDVDLMHEYRNDLKTYLTKSQMQLLLKYNRQYIPQGLDNILDRLSEMLMYGALPKCPSCRHGNLSYSNGGYRCNGFSNAWGKCTAVYQDPLKNPVRIPEELKILFPFLMAYDYVPRSRTIKTSASQVRQEIKPLRTLNFTILGFPPEKETRIRNEIEKQGGRIVSHVKRSVLAIVTTREEYQREGIQITEAKKCQLYIVTYDFIAAVANVVDQETVLQVIKSYDISRSGVQLNCRIPDKYKKNKQSKPNTHEQEEKQDEEKIKKITVKKGIAIESESGLADNAHVYRIDNNVYTAALSRTDIGANKNTYYKLQLLESDNETRYWVYRSWGRTGTDFGSHSVKEYHDLEAAVSEFELEFKKKTGNAWSNRRCMQKYPGKFAYIELDYEASKEEIEDLEKHISSSTLHAAVAHIVALIFNVHAMQQLMLEYSLDTEKMPLGKLSKFQIKQAYSVLSDAVLLINHKHKDAEGILHCSNKFYSLMPYNSALKNPPLLDNMDIVKKKLEMLESLFEIESAYSIIQRKTDENINPLDGYYKELCTDIEPLDIASQDYSVIKDYVTNTHADTHRQYDLEILEIFKVNRHGESEKYDKFRSLHNRQLLWHGSRTTNFAGILSQGLRIAPAEAPANGTMFGKGVYFADMVSKSANYCGITSDGKETDGLLLLCEVALGNMSEKYKACNVNRLPADVHSIKGVGKTFPDPMQNVILPDGVTVPIGKPITNADINCSLRYNEYIVYNVDQIKARYLLKMKFKYKHFTC